MENKQLNFLKFSYILSLSLSFFYLESLSFFYLEANEDEVKAISSKHDENLIKHKITF